jgi:hypothetical protein
MFAQYGKSPGMVDMGMGQQHGLDRARVESQKPVLTVRFLALSLKEAAIQENSIAGHFEQMAASRYGSCGSVE